MPLQSGASWASPPVRAPGDFVTDTVVDPFGNFIMVGQGANASFDEDIYTVRLPKNFTPPSP